MLEELLEIFELVYGRMALQQVAGCFQFADERENQWVPEQFFIKSPHLCLGHVTRFTHQSVVLGYQTPAENLKNKM